MIDFHDPRFQKGHNGTKHKDELTKYYSLTILRASANLEKGPVYFILGKNNRLASVFTCKV